MTSSLLKDTIKESFSPQIIINRFKETYEGWSRVLLGHIACGMVMGWSIIQFLNFPQNPVFLIIGLVIFSLSISLAAFSVNPLFSWMGFLKRTPFFLARLSFLPIFAILMMGNPYTFKVIENIQFASREKILILGMSLIMALFLVFLGIVGHVAESGKTRAGLSQPTLRGSLWIDIKRALVVMRAAWSCSFSALFFMALFFFPLSLLTQVIGALMNSGGRVMSAMPLIVQAIPFGLMWSLLMILPTIASLVSRDYRASALDKFHAKHAQKSSPENPSS